MGRTLLQTDRLVLRDAGPDDVDGVHADIATDFEVVRNTGTWIWPADRAFTASRCLPIPPDMGLGGVVTHDAQIVGMARVFGAGELGYMFARRVWGQGYATEICRALIAAAFDTGRWPRISACVFDGNPGSIRVLEKLGFTEGTRCMGHCASRGDDFPIRNFTLCAPEA